MSGLQEAEKVLQRNMKKKGDAARQLMVSKDEEIKALATELNSLREAIQSEKLRMEREKEQAAVSSAAAAQEKNTLRPPSSPVPGPVTDAALAAMTPVPLGSISLDVVDLATPAPPSMLTTSAPSLAARPMVESTAQKTVAMRQLQNQVVLLISENQALKSRLQMGNITTSEAGPQFLTSLEREQYLRQAFYGLFRAKQGIEMQNLARVMCAILGLNEQQRGEVLERCEVLGTVNMAQSTFADLGGTISSLFA